VNVCITHILTLLINALQHLAIHGLFLYFWMVFYINCCNYFDVSLYPFPDSMFICTSEWSLNFLLSFPNFYLCISVNYSLWCAKLYNIPIFLSVTNPSVSFLIFCQVLQVHFPFRYVLFALRFVPVHLSLGDWVGVVVKALHC
jgi:hypothetical protein